MKSKVKKAIKKVKNVVFGAPKRQPYQILRNNLDSKTELILPVLRKLECKSILDVGCNAGELNRRLANEFFSVGIDQRVDLVGIKEPLRDIVLGEIKVNEKNLNMIPTFDAVSLFGVHHQWYKESGSDFCANLVKKIADRAGKVFFIQFAGINSKYQANDAPDLFIDNDEDSIKKYAERWLLENLPENEVTYLGKTYELDIEPYRYMYSVIKRV